VTAEPAPDAAPEIEAGLLLEAIWRRYGHDFRGYAPATLTRRLEAARERFDVEENLRALEALLRQDGLETLTRARARRPSSCCWSTRWRSR
jgi:chemotaxis protein methyltransferase CheR